MNDPITVTARFSGSHPLAGLARERCTELHGQPPRGMRACGVCWEHVIRTDAAFAALEDLPPETPPADPGLIDEVAVERACTGFPVRLNVAETTAVVLRLRGRGVPFDAIGAQLRMDPDRLRHLARTLGQSLRRGRPTRAVAA